MMTSAERLVNDIRKAEDQIQRAIHEVVANTLNTLCRDTGLRLGGGGIDLKLINVTTLGDETSWYKLGEVRLDMVLPNDHYYG